MKHGGQHNERPFTCHVFEYSSTLSRRKRHENGLLGAVFLPAVPRVGERIVDDWGPKVYGYIVREVFYVTSDNRIELHCTKFVPYEGEELIT